MRVHPPKPTNMTLNLAPMVDVMMCLIIFFLLGSSLALEEGRPVELPFAITAGQAERGDTGARVVVNVRRPESGGDEAEFVIGGAWDGTQVIERKLTPDELERHLAGAAAAAASRGEAVRAVIRADRGVGYGQVETALRACGKAKIGRVIFSANPGRPPEASPTSGGGSG